MNRMPALMNNATRRKVLEGGTSTRQRAIFDKPNQPSELSKR
jgi:hypothetical protein